MRNKELEKELRKKFGSLKAKLAGVEYKELRYDEKRGNGYSPSQISPDGEVYESSLANPDQLDSTATPWYQPPLSEMEQTELESVQLVYGTLTDAQKLVFNRIFKDRLTYREVADELNVSQSAVKTTALRIQNKIKKFHVVHKAQTGGL